MAVPANFACPDREKFRYCYSKLINFRFKEEEPTKTDLNLLLDQLNSLEYSTNFVCEQVCLHWRSFGHELIRTLFIYMFCISLSRVLCAVLLYPANKNVCHHNQRRTALWGGDDKMSNFSVVGTDLTKPRYTTSNCDILNKKLPDCIFGSY